MTAPSDGPGSAAIAAARTLLAPWRWLTAPRFYGLEHVPTDRPVMLVGNHTVIGVLDVPLMPEACRALMAAGESILVFPGGGREVFKRKGEKYRLLWGTRLGFVRLAIEHGYPILPFAAVGGEECYDILVDAGDLLRVVPFLRRVPRADEIPPLVRGVGLSAIPRPERFYFHFGRPIETAYLAGLETADRLCAAVRDQVRAAIEVGLAFLFRERARDPERHPLARLIRRLRGLGTQTEAVRERRPRVVPIDRARTSVAAGVRMGT